MPIERNVERTGAAAKVTTAAKYPELLKGGMGLLQPTIPQSGRLTNAAAIEIFGGRGRREMRGP